MKNKMTDDHLRTLALTMAANCVRNTVIEDYHADGKLSDLEMMEFNKEVANKLYTFLRVGLYGTNRKDKELFMKTQMLMFPHGWDEPSLDDEFMGALALAKDMGVGFKVVEKFLKLS